MIEKEIKAIKLEICADAKVSEDIFISYKGKKISAAVESIKLNLTSDNTDNIIRDLIKNSKVCGNWVRFDRQEFNKYLDRLLKWD